MKLSHSLFATLLFIQNGASNASNPMTNTESFSSSNPKFVRHNLRDRLLRPSPNEKYKSGGSSSRRLERNKQRLDHHQDQLKIHRQLRAQQPVQDVTAYDGTTITSVVEFFNSTKWDDYNFRIQPDKPVMDMLPPGLAAGVQPGWPQATKGYWDGEADVYAEAMWEIVACPVVDPEGFLENPILCYFNEDDDASLADFFLNEITDEGIKDFMYDVMAPVAADIVVTLSPLPFFASLLKQVCQVLSLVDDIEGIVKDIEDVANDIWDAVAGAFEDAGDWAEGAVNDAGDWFEGAGDTFSGWFSRRGRNLMESDTEDILQCEHEHKTSCDGTSVCDACLDDADAANKEECQGCSTCYRPYYNSVPDMKGVCINTIFYNQLQREKHIPAAFLTQLSDTLLALYVRDNVATSHRVMLEKMDLTLTDFLGQTETTIVNAIEGAQKTISETITDTCEADSGSTRRLQEQQKTGTMRKPKDVNMGSIRGSDKVSDKKKKTIDDLSAKLRLGDEQQDEIINTLMGHVDELGNKIDDDNVRTVVKDAMVNSGVDTVFASSMQQSLSDPGVAEQLASRVVNQARDPVTNKVSLTKLQEIRRGLSHVAEDEAALTSFLSKKRGAKEGDNASDKSARSRSRNLGLVEDCEEAIDDVVEVIKDIVTTGIRFSIDSEEAIADVFGEDSTIGQAALKYKDFKTNIKTGILALFYPFLDQLDPLSVSSIVYAPTMLLAKFFQKIAAWTLFNCDFDDEECQDQLPSKGRVLPIMESAPDENGDTDYFMVSGCDSNFEGELVFYDPVLDALTEILDGASEAIPPVFNAPVVILKVFIDITHKLFQRMGNACDYLDGYVELSMVEANFHNTRYLLNEVACRPVDQLLKGHGCDGIDNNCDASFLTDECDEDIFPPSIDVSSAMVDCTQRAFATVEEAKTCVMDRLVVEDDCREVITELTTEEITPAEEDDDTDEYCSSSTSVTPNVKIWVIARAVGCGFREMEDTTFAEVPVRVDATAPVVQCSFAADAIPIEHSHAFVDSRLKFHVGNTSGKEHDCGAVDVEVKILSSEMVAPRQESEMFVLSEPRHGLEEETLRLFVETDDCEEKDVSDGKCRMMDSTDKARTYVVQVTATDAAGNIGSDECSLVVYHPQYEKSGGKSGPKVLQAPPEPDGDILFLLGSYKYSSVML